MTRRAAETCALPGCDAIIRPTEGRPPRKYCSAAHRAASRRLHRSVGVEDVAGTEVSAIVERVDVFDAGTLDAAPVDYEPVGHESVDADPVDHEPVGHESVDADPVDTGFFDETDCRDDPEVSDAAADSEVDLAADGQPEELDANDDSEADSETGRDTPAATDAPPRRRAERSRTVPWDAVPSAAAARARAAKPTEARETRRRAEAAKKRRRRAMAVLSAAGILAGGGGWVAVNSASGPAAPTPTGSGQDAVSPEDAARWAGRAEVALASVSQQLDAVAQVHQEWTKQPVARQWSTPPAPVAEMLQRKAVLEQQKATLQSQLSAWRSLNQVTGELDVANKQLAAVERVLSEAPQATKPTSEQASSAKQLADQREIRIRQRDAKKQELETLQKGVQTAVVAPLQDAAEKTKALTESVLGLIHNPNSAPQSSPPAHQPPSAVAGPVKPDRQRQDVNNSAPPDPRGVPGAPPNPGKSAADSLGKAVDGVAGAAGSLLGGKQPKAKPDKQAPEAAAAERQQQDRGRTPAGAGQQLRPTVQDATGAAGETAVVPRARRSVEARPSPQQAAIELARQVAPRWTANPAAAMLPRMAWSGAEAAASDGSEANREAPRRSRAVTVDQLVDYAWNRAMDEAQQRGAAPTREQGGGAEPGASQRVRDAGGDEQVQQYREMVSAWSTGR